MLVALWTAAHGVAAPVASATDPGADAVLEARCGQLRNGAEVKVAGRSIASTIVLPGFYERRGFRPAWTSRSLDALVAALRDVPSDGLLPDDYHLSVIESLRQAPPGPTRDADLDMLATDAVVRLAYHLRFGKVEMRALDQGWNFRHDLEAALPDAAAIRLQELLDGARGAEFLAAERPAHSMYRRLRDGLAAYRRIQAAGAWRSTPPGPSLKPGETDPRVPALRTRLRAEGDLAPGAPASGDGYDPALADAVRRFQARHGLTPDGAIGPATLRALNVPVETRIDQLRLSLERARHVLRDLPGRFVVVNVPAFRVFYTDEHGRWFSSRAITGKPYTSTPIFRADITQVVLNPSWTIPPGILRRDVTPGVNRDPDYLAKKGFRKVGDQVVQPPGPNNALGRIKLNFPNPHLVYMHDTPQRNLFGEDTRAFSSGCIRVQDIEDLAVLLLDDAERWSKAQLQAEVARGRTQFINLERPVPVLLLYWTAGVGVNDGQVYFYEDVYKRDARELAALNGPFRFSRQVGSGAAGASATP